MRQQSINYAKVLYDLHIDPQEIADANTLIRENEAFSEVLFCKVYSYNKKKTIVEKVFSTAGYSKELIHFLCILCKNGAIDTISEVTEAYIGYVRKMEQVLTATLYYVTPPDETQITQIKTKLMHDFHAKSVELILVEKPEILGGFIIEAGGKQIDFSLLGRSQRLRQKLLRR